MHDFLKRLALSAEKRVYEGYYRFGFEVDHRPLSLRKSVLEFAHAPIIAELKQASPSLGTIRWTPHVGDAAMRMADGGAIAISVLTEPRHFRGSLSNLIEVREAVDIPILMKDIFLSRVQVEAASSLGADAVLLIKALFDRGYCECSLMEMIDYAHSKELEVLLETHTLEEFTSALESEAELIGINNRDLSTLTVDIGRTRRILKKVKTKGRIVVSESGIQTPTDIMLLHNSGAQAFLVGTSIMMAGDLKKKVEELVLAI